ncbi:MAG: sulfur carrier protein ThiS [Bacteroidales bacterium]|nr:sulfur carrier protein ThiS [Bacteroidales bacterium]MDZ4205271.1 sulfur carrier protein ThiS [Bacteroidales bacterium]
MKITLNNMADEFDANEITVDQLLALKNFTFKMLVVKLNGQVIRKHEFETVTIKDGDEVAVIHLISGG